MNTAISQARGHPEHFVSIPLKNGECLQGRLHADLRKDVEWRGRCVDLSKAYKQVPVSTGSRPFAVLMVHHFETGRPVYFISNSLPFGASASVFGFNRISRSLWHAASVCCGMMGGVFYDDFPFIEPAPLCTLASHSFEGLLKALGWRYSDDPKKSHPFETSFE